MYIVKKTSAKSNIFVGLFICIIAIGITFAFVVMPKLAAEKMDSQVMSSRVEVMTSRASKGGTTYTPIYHYYVSGKEYTCGKGYSTGSYPSSDNVVVYYDSQNPGDCVITTIGGDYVFFIIPGVFFLAGIAVIYSGFKQLLTLGRLEQNGRLIRNLPYEIRSVTSGSSKNRSTDQHLVVMYQLSNGKSVELVSTKPFSNKELAQGHKTAELLIDPDDIDNFYIDFKIEESI